MAISFNTSAFADSSGQTTSIAITVPAGVLVGDLVIVTAEIVPVVATLATLSVSATKTVPVQIGTTQSGLDAGTAASSATAYYSFTAASGDPGSNVITVTSSITGFWTVSLVSYTGAGAVDNFAFGPFTSPGGTSITAPSVTTIANNCWVLNILAGAAENGAPSSPATLRIGHISSVEVFTTVSDTNASVGPGGTTQTGVTWTFGSASTSEYQAAAISIAPPGSAPTPVTTTPLVPRWPYLSKKYNVTPFTVAKAPTIVAGLTATDTVAANMGLITFDSPIQVSDLTNGNNTSTSSAVTASITPAPNSLLLLWTGAWDGGAGNTTNVTSVTGLGLAWNTVTSVLPGGVKGQAALWYAITGPNPGSGTVTINLATASAICWDIDQVTGANLSSPFVTSNTRTNSSSSTNPNLTFNAAANINNVFVASGTMEVQAAASVVLSAGETIPWMILSNQESNTANNNTAMMTQVSQVASVAGTAFSVNSTVSHSWGAVGAEIQVAPAQVFSSAFHSPFSQVFKTTDKNVLRVQIPQQPVTPGTPANVNGLVASVNVAANFGGIADIHQTTSLPTHGWPYFNRAYHVTSNKPNTFINGTSSNVNAVANFGTLSVNASQSPSNVSVSAAFDGFSLVHQTTSMPTHGWPYLSKRYIVAPSKPNTFISGTTSGVSAQANFGTIKVTGTGITSSVNISANPGSFFIFSAQSVPVPFPKNTPWPLALRRIVPQHGQYPQPAAGSVNGITALVNVAANNGTIKVTTPGNTSSVTVASPFGNLAVIHQSTTLPTHGWPYFSKRYIVSPNKPITFPSVSFAGTTSAVNVQATFGTVKQSVSAGPANVNVAANFGGFTIISTLKTSIQQFPFAANIPYPLNIIKRIRPQHPVLVISHIIIPGITANETVTANMGTPVIKRIPVTQWKIKLVKPTKARLYVP